MAYAFCVSCVFFKFCGNICRRKTEMCVELHICNNGCYSTWINKKSCSGNDNHTLYPLVENLPFPDVQLR